MTTKQHKTTHSHSHSISKQREFPSLKFSLEFFPTNRLLNLESEKKIYSTTGINKVEFKHFFNTERTGSPNVTNGFYVFVLN